MIRDLVGQCNVYTKETKSPNTLLLRDVAAYITQMFVVFGAITSAHDGIGFPIDSESAGLNVMKNAAPILHITLIHRSIKSQLDTFTLNEILPFLLIFRKIQTL